MAVVPAVLVTAGVLVDFAMVSTGATTVNLAVAATALLTVVAPFKTLSAFTGSVLV